MRLTKNNYYSPEANREYMSASFIKAVNKCPAQAVAELRGEWTRPESSALLVGNYVDSYFEGVKNHAKFVATHPEIFKRDGTLKAEYVKASEMIARAERSEMFKAYMSGQKQKIITGKLFGSKFKAKLDVYKKGERIVDLKTVKDMLPVYKEGQGRVSFAEAWDWPLQMAIYQALEGHNLPCYLAVITKENPPDIAVIQIPQAILDAKLEYLESHMFYYDGLHKGYIQPERCEACAYCRETKELKDVITLEE